MTVLLVLEIGIMIGISRIITLIITITHVDIINTIRRSNVVIIVVACSLK
jgi:hypothetical protein